MSSNSPLVEIFTDTSFSCYSSHFNSSVAFLMTRTSCLCESSYLASSSANELIELDKLPGFPIHVAAKSKCCRRVKNVFIDDRGFPDQLYEFKVLLYNIDGRPFQWEVKHPPPPLIIDAPLFSF
jgi:hypothetical protein